MLRKPKSFVLFCFDSKIVACNPKCLNKILASRYIYNIYIAGPRTKLPRYIYFGSSVWGLEFCTNLFVHPKISPGSLGPRSSTLIPRTLCRTSWQGRRVQRAAGIPTVDHEDSSLGNLQLHLSIYYSIKFMFAICNLC